MGLHAGPWPNFGFQCLGQGGNDINDDDLAVDDCIAIGLHAGP